jgi:hypothetical protein
MNRRTLLKSLLAVPFLPKILSGQVKEKTNNDIVRSLDFKQTLDRIRYPEKSDYVKKTVYYPESGVLYEGQYVIYTGWLGTYHADMMWKNKNLRWWPNWNVITNPRIDQSFNYDDDILKYEIRKAKSWKDIMESCDDNTFAGVVRKQMQGPGLVKIYASKLSLEQKNNQSND